MTQDKCAVITKKITFTRFSRSKDAFKILTLYIKKI